jgi:hypothetical protein
MARKKDEKPERRMEAPEEWQDEEAELEGVADNLLGLLSDDLTIEGSSEKSKADNLDTQGVADADDEEDEGAAVGDTEDLEDDEESEEESEDDEEEDSEEDDADDETDDEDDDEEEEEEESEEDDFFEVRVAGETRKVSLDQLKENFSKGEDYTRKTQHAAEARREADAELEAARKARNEYGERLDVLGTALAEAMPQEPDWEQLRRDKPQDYLMQRADWQARQDKLQKVAEERARVAQEQEQDSLRERQKLMTAEAERLVEAIPEWKDEEVAKAETASLREEGLLRGFTAEELDAVVDHRAVMLLRDAMRYRELTTKGKKKLKGKKKSKSKTLQPGKGSNSSRKSPSKKKAGKAKKRARERLAKSGGVDDAAAAIYGTLDDDLI